MIAFFAAVVNIAGNAFLGTHFRIKNHYDIKKASLGKLYFTLAFLLIFLINGGIAFYRLRYASMTEGLTDAFWLESAMLFMIGIGMGIAAFYKGYGMDDPYHPQYGHYDREFKKRAKRLQSIQSAHALYCTSLKQEADSNLDHLGTKILTTFDAFGNHLPEMARCLKAWEGDRTQVNFVYRQLQEIFKITISAHHSKGENGYRQAIQDLPKNTQLESYKIQIDSFTKQKSAIKEQVTKLRQSVIAQKEALQKWWQGSGTAALLEFPKLGAKNNKNHEKPVYYPEQ